eukprot:CAMPEP_0176235282 /NCGR_PEP_ID=MMETSP0121_2-20121125/26758_1 /TAXON_ID=160619 /ORGANISM="Kryptoperidinium foliaceum, Strain CCMP 1326" /LENGTH=318 /DNA_ID=CAMNT_0017574699 /DNA_START=164 /DNA_END=1120 /DNA_ORIENTATION=-
MRFGQQHQATVTINALDGVQFAGEVAANPKAAEQAAAKIVLDNYAEEVALIMSKANASKNKKKRKANEILIDPAEAVATGGLSALLGTAGAIDNAKVKLNNALMRLVRRPVSKGDVNFHTVQTAVGFQCTISMPCLPGDWGGLAWAGEVASKKKQAEENAAQQAVNAIEADPEMMAQIMMSISRSQASAGKSKRARWGEEDWSGMSPHMAAAMAQYSQSISSPCGGKGAASAASAPVPRIRITSVPVSGVICEWAGSYGWIKPYEPIKHDSARLTEGRIHLDAAHWKHEAIPPAEGTIVQCHVYEDPAGLSADDVTPL